MKLSNFFKFVPSLSILILLIFIFINNQKESTKLRILIWDTPSLSLGTYLVISTGTGFLLSYVITSNLARIYQLTGNEPIKYKIDNNKEESDELNEKNINSRYENTLIERDLADPSPTINASFRVIGKTKKRSSNYIDNYQNDDYLYNNPNEVDEEYSEQYEKYERNNLDNAISTDWNDESFSSW